MITTIAISLFIIGAVLLVANKTSRHPFLKTENSARKVVPESTPLPLVGTWVRESDTSGTLGDEIEFSSENGVQKFTARYYDKTRLSAGTWKFIPGAPNQYAELLSGELTIVYEGGSSLRVTTITMNDRERLGVDDHGDSNGEPASCSYKRIE